MFSVLCMSRQLSTNVPYRFFTCAMLMFKELNTLIISDFILIYCVLRSMKGTRFLPIMESPKNLRSSQRRSLILNSIAANLTNTNDHYETEGSKGVQAADGSEQDKRVTRLTKRSSVGQSNGKETGRYKTLRFKSHEYQGHLRSYIVYRLLRSFEIRILSRII